MNRPRQSNGVITIPTRAVTNRMVHHTITVDSRVVSDGPRLDWSWIETVAELERRWPNGRVTVERGLGRHRRMIYVTATD